MREPVGIGQQQSNGRNAAAEPRQRRMKRAIGWMGFVLLLRMDPGRGFAAPGDSARYPLQARASSVLPPLAWSNSLACNPDDQFSGWPLNRFEVADARCIAA